MYVKEIWRYPVKSMAGERMAEATVTPLGLAGDREVLVVGPNGRVVTARTHPWLLGLRGTEGDGLPEGYGLIRHSGPERFDVLPLLVATDGAIAYMGFDGRRLRPNLVIGGVEGLAEREWAGRRLRIGDVVLEMAQLRGRCVMTTFDPDTLQQDRGVLQRIVRELDGTMGLDTAVIGGGVIREGDPVFLLPAHSMEEGKETHL